MDLDDAVRAGKTYFCAFLYTGRRRSAWRHVGVVTHNAQSGGGGKKPIMFTVYISVCVQKKQKRLESIRHFPLSGQWWLFDPSCSVGPPHGEPLPVIVKPLLVVLFSEGVNVTRVLLRVHSVYFLQRLNVYIVWKHVSVDKKKKKK